MIRSSSAIKTWLPISLAAGVITFLMISILASIPLERAIVGSALTAILVFSGMLFRSFGKEKDRYRSVAEIILGRLEMIADPFVLSLLTVDAGYELFHWMRT